MSSPGEHQHTPRTVVVLAMLTATLPPLLISGGATVSLAGISHTFSGSWQTWFIRGLTLLVIACPCTFVISNGRLRRRWNH